MLRTLPLAALAFAVSFTLAQYGSPILNSGTQTMAAPANAPSPFYQQPGGYARCYRSCR